MEFFTSGSWFMDGTNFFVRYASNMFLLGAALSDGRPGT